MPLPDVSTFPLRPRPRRRYLLLPSGLLTLLLLPRLGQAQIIDDSTKVVYGPKTTLVVREVNVLRNQPEGTPLDTTLTGMQNSRNWYYDSTFQQSLGNVALASRRLLWTPNTQLGARFGRDAFNKYFRDQTTIPYYDTRSPYTFFRFVQGGVGEQIFEGMYSRSVKKAVNVGIAYERFGANKQLGTTLSRDQQVAHSGVLIFARYQTKNDRYHVLLNYYVAQHRVIEQGGIRPPSDTAALTDLFGYRDENVWLRQAKNEEKRDQFHLAHTYNLLGRGVTAFHVLDWRRQYDRFSDDFAANVADRDYYSVIRLDSSKTDDRATYRQFDNTVGLLGRADWAEYRVYGRYRSALLTSRSNYGNPETLHQALPDVTASQIFVGGNLAFRWRKIFEVDLAGEYKFFDEVWARGRLRFGPLSAEALHSSYAPTLTQQQFSGNHQLWSDFADRSPNGNTTVDQLTVALDQRLGAADARLQQRIQLSGSVVNILNLVYYGQTGNGVRSFRPFQLDGSKQLLIGFVRHQLRYGILRLDNQLTYTQGGEDVDHVEGSEGKGLRIPKLVGNSRVYVEGFIFKKALFTQIGVETFIQSCWQPYDYDPSTQQFFVQNHFTAGNAPVADVFLTADIKTVSVFLKMAYVNQGLGKDGYYAAPFYTGNPRSFQLGLKWNFFD